MKLPNMSCASPMPTDRDEKSSPPQISPITGPMISSTTDVTIAVNAPPIIIPTAILITSPFAINSLNSLINAFIRYDLLINITIYNGTFYHTAIFIFNLEDFFILSSEILLS